MLNKVHFEEMMETATFRWFLNIFLAVVIFSNCEVGRLIGSKDTPFAISLVWPATGFALAALLLFGNQALVGIFLGNFCYNTLHFFLSHQGFFTPLLASIVVTFGSVLQAFMSAFIIQRYSSTLYFSTVKDIIIFLIPAGIVSCMIASSFGLITLYFYGMIPSNFLFNDWAAFWIGDTLGLYILTPFLVIWASRKPEVVVSQHRIETCFMALSFVLLSYLSFVQGHPVTRLFIPLIFWVAYRFLMHGATLAIFIIAFGIIFSASFGEQSFINTLTASQLMNLVSYAEIFIAICLVFAAAVNERDAKNRAS